MGKRARAKLDEADYSPAGVGSRGSPCTERKAGRGAVACLQCRSRKSVCSLSGPACEGCQHRGEGDLCSFQAMIWIDNLDDLPSRQLKRKVDRLEALLNSLQNMEDSPSVATSAAEEATGPQRAASAPPATPTEKTVLQLPPRARTQDCDALVRLLLADGEIPTFKTININAATLTAQLRQDEQDHAPLHPILDAPHPSTLQLPVSAEEHRRGIEGVLPTLEQAQVCLTAYFALANNFLRLVHPPTFLAQFDTYWRKGTTPEPAWLATFVIICAYGLLAAPDGGDLARSPFLPSGPARELLARSWFDAAGRILAENHFLTKPTIEGVRAYILLIQWWMSEGARYAEAALSVGVAVASGCFDLQLNRDPDEVDPDLPPHEAEVRRRVFWTLFVFEAMVRPMLGKAWQPFDEDDITTRMPKSEEPGSTGALYQVAVLNARITRLISRPQTLSAPAVATIFDDLQQFFDVHRENALAVAMARFSYNRLHRFAYRAGLSTADTDATAARVLSCLLDSIGQSSGVPNCPAIVLLRAFSAAIAAAAELNGTSYALASIDPIGHQLYRLLADLPRLQFPPGHVRLVRRASLILSSLLPLPEPSPPISLDIYSEDYSDLSVGPSALATPITADNHCHIYPLANGFVATEHYLSSSQNVLPSPVSFDGSAERYALAEDVMTHPAGLNYQMPKSAPPEQTGFAAPNSVNAARRPILSLHTAEPAVPSHLKAPPSHVSPWIDAAITPSRYVTRQPWEPTG